jgi:hypothetical protein
VTERHTYQRPRVKKPTKGTVFVDILYAVLAVVPPLLVTGLLWPPILVLAFMGFMEDLLLYLVPAIAVPLWIWFFRRRIRKWKPATPELISLGVRCGLYAILCAGALAVLALSCGSTRARMLAGVVPRIRKDADITAIRAWTESYRKSIDPAAETQEKGSSHMSIDQDKLPKCISVLHPRWVTYDADTKCLSLRFCIRMQHFSLLIAVDDSSLYEQGEHDMELEPGVWILDGQADDAHRHGR